LEIDEKQTTELLKFDGSSGLPIFDISALRPAPDTLAAGHICSPFSHMAQHPIVPAFERPTYQERQNGSRYAQGLRVESRFADGRD